MKKTRVAFFICMIFVVGFVLGGIMFRTDVPADSTIDKETVPTIIEYAQKEDLIRVTSPAIDATISSPLVITGSARGNWFFEASFPVTLTDWDGRIIAQHYAMTADEWMTSEYVTFESVLEFENPYKQGDPDFMRRGTLILHKDNPSGLPEHDDALEFTVWFE